MQLHKSDALSRTLDRVVESQDLTPVLLISIAAVVVWSWVMLFTLDP